MTRLRTVAACHKAASEQYRRIAMPVRPNFPPLSPELQARADQEWKEL